MSRVYFIRNDSSMKAPVWCGVLQSDQSVATSSTPFGPRPHTGAPATLCLCACFISGWFLYSSLLSGMQHPPPRLCGVSILPPTHPPPPPPLHKGRAPLRVHSWEHSSATSIYIYRTSPPSGCAHRVPPQHQEQCWSKKTKSPQWHYAANGSVGSPSANIVLRCTCCCPVLLHKFHRTPLPFLLQHLLCLCSVSS